MKDLPPLYLKPPSKPETLQYLEALLKQVGECYKLYNETNDYGKLNASAALGEMMIANEKRFTRCEDALLSAICLIENYIPDEVVARLNDEVAQ